MLVKNVSFSLSHALFFSGVPVNEYISFFGMRNHGVLMGYLVSEKFH
jgi:hypothetical protein